MTALAEKLEPLPQEQFMNPHHLIRALIAPLWLLAVAGCGPQTQDAGNQEALELGSTSQPVLVRLQNATATFSQISSGNWFPNQTVDGIVNGYNGWAVMNDAVYPTTTEAQTIVYETASTLGSPYNRTQITFKLIQGFGGAHNLGRFRLYVTTADRSLFADGANRLGQIGPSSIWTVVFPAIYSTQSGATLTRLSDMSLLASGTLSDTDTYTVTTTVPFVGITGIRLDAMTDGSLPTWGPGRQPSNGNFVLSEFQADMTGLY